MRRRASGPLLPCREAPRSTAKHREAPRSTAKTWVKLTCTAIPFTLDFRPHYCFISLDCCLLLSICVISRCVLHPLPLPLSSCLGCIPPLIGLPSLRFYAVGSSLFLLSVCFCLCSLFYRDDVLCWLLLARPFLYAFHAHLRFPVDLVWFRLSCDHGWIRSGSVNVRKQQQQQQLHKIEAYKVSHGGINPVAPGPRPCSSIHSQLVLLFVLGYRKRTERLLPRRRHLCTG